MIHAAREAIQNCIKSISCLCTSIVFIVTSIMAALEWNTNLYLLPVAHQAQAGPRLVQNSSARNRLSFFLLSNDRTDPLWTHRCSSKIRSARCRFSAEIASTKLVTVNSRRTVHEETRLERIEKFSRWILVKCFPWIYIYTIQEDARSIASIERGEISDEGSMKNHLAWPRDSAPETRRWTLSSSGAISSAKKSDRFILPYISLFVI